MARLEIETYHDANIQGEAIKELARAYQALQDLQHPQNQAWSKDLSAENMTFMRNFYSDIASSPSAAYRHVVMSRVEDIARAFEPDYRKRAAIYQVDIKTGPNITIHCVPALAMKIMNQAQNFPGISRIFPANTAKGPSFHP